MIKSSIPWNAKQIAKSVKNGVITFNNPIQRGYVWDDKKGSLLIDSMYRNYPIPPMFATKSEEQQLDSGKKSAVYDILDGKQRMTTVVRFLNDEFRLSGLEEIECDDGSIYNPNGKTFSELPEELQDSISSYSFTIFFFLDTTDEEVSEMMSRLNNGKVLTGTENARIKARNLNAIRTLAGHKLFIENLSQTAIKGYANEDIIMKLSLLINDQCDLSTKNVKSAYETFEFGENMVNTINETLDFVWSALKANESNKKVVKRICGKANLITVLYTAYLFIEDTDNKQDDKIKMFADKILQFYDGEEKGGTISSEYNSANINATMRSDNVITRNDELYGYIMAD